AHMERGTALRGLAKVALVAGRRDDARRHATEALEAYRSVGERFGEVNVLADLAAISEVVGRWDEAADLRTQARDRAVEVGYGLGAAIAESELAHLQVRRGRYGSALASAGRAREFFAAAPDAHGWANANVNLGKLLL